jgi:hypothetical protein
MLEAQISSIFHVTNFFTFVSKRFDQVRRSCHFMVNSAILLSFMHVLFALFSLWPDEVNRLLPQQNLPFLASLATPTQEKYLHLVHKLLFLVMCPSYAEVHAYMEVQTRSRYVTYRGSASAGWQPLHFDHEIMEIGLICSNLIEKKPHLLCNTGIWINLVYL